ncbi:TIGR03016 family PEP-CTERM system-associated outer membrane protein [Aestuariibacter halophilus]|uniref:TIGR03016 family PEP-CTERM system-associated outer membrane protein n=1 Tax=Fluctibacter halophilus TaxID=226011 RepID=A0ABS8G2P6_9ALTE|nr:TIGR03016 family PEP-CTERM system-associated outer membrane protein [Aestuariibacter halophilus]MCC2614849.1 TIGR03016 family PEP-CTERM system-associated outer membrane protein [Aestuariibacter halophilus]
MHWRKSALFATNLLAFNVSVALAGEVDVVADTVVAYTNYELDHTEDTQTSGVDALTVKPSLALSAKGNDYSARASASYEYFDRHRFGDPLTGNLALDPDKPSHYTRYSYGADYEIIDNILSVNVKGAQSQRAGASSYANVDNQLLGSNQLIETRSHGAGYSLSLLRGDYVALTSLGSYNKLKSDGRTDNTSDDVIREGLDTENSQAFVSLSQGRALKRATWNLSARYQKNDGNTLRNLESRSYSGNLSFPLFSSISLLAQGQREENEFSSGTSELSVSDLEFTSYGIGLRYAPGIAQRIEVTYNDSDRTDNTTTDDSKQYLGVNIDWAFSRRTRLQASYGRNYFGETGNLNFSHSARYVRTSAYYSESVTTFSRLVATEASLGTFVCPEEATSFADCFLPDSPNYELNAGESFTDLVVTVPDINEEVVYRKAGGMTVGYDSGKLAVGLTVGTSDTEYLTLQRDWKTRSVSLNGSYKLGARTSLFSSLSKRKIERQAEGREDDIASASVGVKHQLPGDISTSLDVQYMDRDSTTNNLDLTERRVSFSIRVPFTNN